MGFRCFHGISLFPGNAPGEGGFRCFPGILASWRGALEGSIASARVPFPGKNERSIASARVPFPGKNERSIASARVPFPGLLERSWGVDLVVLGWSPGTWPGMGKYLGLASTYLVSAG